MNYLGEIIETKTDGFIAQCPKSLLHQPPVFGSFVKTLPPNSGSSETSGFTEQGAYISISGAADLSDYDPFAEIDSLPSAQSAKSDFSAPAGALEETSFAIVCFATTGSFDFGRRASAYELSEEDLMESQPQIYELLCTEFSAIPIGYVSGGRMRTGIPPQPPRIHARVLACNDEEIIAVSDSPDFMRLLMRAQAESSPDNLILGAVEIAWKARKKNRNFLVRMGKQLVALLSRDAERLNFLLERLGALESFA